MVLKQALGHNFNILGIPARAGEAPGPSFG